MTKLTLGTLIQDGMVLQRNAPVRIYGKATAGNRVVVAIQDTSATATADSNGNWSATLNNLSAGGPFTLTVTSGGETVLVGDVLVGEVWVCSGQSNMEWVLANSTGGAEETMQANDPQLRMFIVNKAIQATPQESATGSGWLPATPKTAGGFSGVGYYFAKELRKSLKVPVGMIFTAWGGTRIQAWMKRDVLAANGTAESEFVPLTQTAAAIKVTEAKMARQMAVWKAAGSPTGAFMDPGILPKAQDWASADLNASDWKNITLPQPWEKAGIEELEYLDGAVWFRKEVPISASQAGQAMTLSLGAFDDFDTTYFNGVKVGGLGAETPNVWQAKRVYTIPANLVKAGKNVIAVRVWDGQGEGGSTGPADAMKLFSPTTSEPISLAGKWQYRIENGRPGAPQGAAGLDPNTATVLYNAMIAPFTKYTIKGAIWYQGESNSGEATRYATLMPAMIQNWRDDWGIRDFPFYMVQLAPFGSGNSTGTWYAETREAQLHSTKVLKNVGMAVTVGVGNEMDIHPKDKKTVGERLSLLARKNAYKEKVLADSPEPKSFTFNADGSVLIRFENAGDGLNTGLGLKTVDGYSVSGFTVAGDDGKFVPARAKIVGKDSIQTEPIAGLKASKVRYGFVNYDGTLILANSAGIPATPFRSDTPVWFGKKKQ